MNSVEEFPSSCSVWYNPVIKGTRCRKDVSISALAWVDVRDLAVTHNRVGRGGAGGERIMTSVGMIKLGMTSLQHLDVKYRVARMGRQG